MRMAAKLQQVLIPRVVVKGGVQQEIEAIGKVLLDMPDRKAILRRIGEELSRGKTSHQSATGMTAEQALKVGILRNRFEWTYRQLEHQTKDSLSVRAFLGLGMEEFFSKSRMNANMKLLSKETWELINESMKKLALQDDIEDGSVLRGDTTAIETNIHHPTDASLLEDIIRVGVRTLSRLSVGGNGLEYHNHTRRAASLVYVIHNTRSEERRRLPYKELIGLAKRTLGYCENALKTLEKCGSVTDGEKEVERLRALVPHARKVVDQAYRRVILGEAVPAEEKIVSIFEPHSDIVVKGSRPVTFGHKVALGIGSTLILSAHVLDGNPQDKTTLITMIDAHQKTYAVGPKAAAFDGAYTSDTNLKYAKESGVEELTFSKNGAIALENLVSSKAVHSMLVRFRAGAEGMISFLKRCFGCRRILDKGKEGFEKKVMSAVVSFNVLAIARARLRFAQ